VGQRGPKRGVKKTAATKATAKPATPKAPRAPRVARTPVATVVQAAAPVLSASDRENPSKLSGADLRELGYRRGLSRSEMADMSDEKVREQLKYLVHRQYEEA